jgi:hypothetical protein
MVREIHTTEQKAFPPHTVIRTSCPKERKNLSPERFNHFQYPASQPLPPSPSHRPCKKQKMSCNTVSNQFTFFVTLKINTSHGRPIKIGLPNNFLNNHKFLMKHRDRPNNGTVIITNLFLMSVSSKLKGYILD